MLDDSVQQQCGDTHRPPPNPLDGPPDVPEMERLLMKHTPYLIRYIEDRFPARARGHLAVEDVLQDIFAAAFRTRSGFRYFASDSFARWITTIADRRLIDLKRAEQSMKRGGHRRQFPLEPPDTSPRLVRKELAAATRTPSREVAVEEARSALLAALATLPPDERDAIIQVEFEGRRHDIVAREMGRSESALRSILHRARLRLRDCLGDPARFFSESAITTAPRGDSAAQ